MAEKISKTARASLGVKGSAGQARNCPQCGSDDRTGWSDEAAYGTEDLPSGYGGDDDFDYDAFVEREFGNKRRSAVFPSDNRGRAVFFIAVILVAAMIYVFVFP